MKKNILTIGAYERDNFGDLLFFIVLKAALQNYQCNLVPSSVIASDMREYFGEFVYPYHFLLQKYRWDAVWVVGGQIGACDKNSGLKMSLSRENLTCYELINDSDKKLLRKYFIGNDNEFLAYLPSIKDYAKNKHTKYIINSVGDFENLRKGFLFDNTCKILKSANYVSVRSEQAFSFLNSMKINSELVPDVVHAIAKYYNHKSMDSNEYILFQINRSLIQKYSIERIATNLNELMDEYNCNLNLFIAGSANLHDSVEEYEKIRNYLNSHFKKNNIFIVKEKDPLDLVNWIADAKIWIGSSLHGRIISIAYEVPRISFKTKKVTNYCNTWDNIFPFDIDIDELNMACKNAFSINGDYMKKQSNILGDKANINLCNMIKFVYEK